MLGSLKGPRNFKSLILGRQTNSHTPRGETLGCPALGEDLRDCWLLSENEKTHTHIRNAATGMLLNVPQDLWWISHLPRSSLQSCQKSHLWKMEQPKPSTHFDTELLTEPWTVYQWKPPQQQSRGFHKKPDWTLRTWAKGDFQSHYFIAAAYVEAFCSLPFVEFWTVSGFRSSIRLLGTESWVWRNN